MGDTDLQNNSSSCRYKTTSLDQSRQTTWFCHFGPNTHDSAIIKTPSA
jgi:hypothetical protein